ncbi:MAG: helix-turn-helix domain-containing protein [Coriobacteriales bacterium]|nr:helix-turn-helix domain-containing protein [Coriobacteriales bacterium]
MIFIREFELFENEGMTLAIPHDMPGGTEGYNFQDAIEMAADWLRMMAEDALIRGVDLPGGNLGQEPEHGGKMVIIAIQADLKNVPSITALEAAQKLGISQARVKQLCDSGLLESWKIGRTRMVSLDSVNARLAEQPKAGRPKQTEVVSA